jgi:hypothetical protein
VDDLLYGELMGYGSVPITSKVFMYCRSFEASYSTTHAGWFGSPAAVHS